MNFKFVCLNLWFGGKFWDEIQEFLKSENPDILILQEVYNAGNPKLSKQLNSYTELSKLLPGYSSDFQASFIESFPEGDVEWGNAVFSRFPILSGKSVFYDVPFGAKNSIGDDHTQNPRNLQYVEIKMNDRVLNVFNTQGIWGFDGLDNERRLNMSRVIVDQIKDKKNVILGGDFNVDQNTKSIKAIEMHLRNIFKGELQTSFNMNVKTGGGFARAVVDMIFVDPSMKVIDHYCPKVDVSDHLPLVAKIEINEKA